ncbi:MAG: TetR/AcrR family transcriptional regulator [Lachnospiraceae bacterium]|nr:TetR/AcrR family transcriptional regulator [Lachnospiraceae bacterium]
MNTTNGKIAEQSKKKIADALLVVLQQYGYKEITITQLAQEAKLSRKTFYRLFADKEDVLSYLFEKLYIECFEQIKSQHTQYYWDIVQCYFDFWEERKSLLLLFKQSHLLPVLFDGAYKYSFGIFEYIRSKDVAEHLSLQLPYLLAYSVGGMHSMLLKWVENDMTVPSQILIEQLKNGFNSIEL